jgi:hypothetical protein
MTWVAVAIGGSALVGAYGANKAANAQVQGTREAIASQEKMFNIQNEQQKPYREAGYSALSDISGMKPYLTHQFGQEDFQAGIDPSYNWRLQQGNLATTNLANRAGGAIGGNALQGLTDYGQNAASQEFGNAFNRYQTQRSNIYNTLASIAGIGQTAQGQTSQLAQNVANNIGQAQIGGANAAAGGIVGGANALSGGLQNYGNMQYISSLLKPQSSGGVTTGSPYSFSGGGGANIDEMGGGRGIQFKT